jgi:hypothetical protein
VNIEKKATTTNTSKQPKKRKVVSKPTSTLAVATVGTPTPTKILGVGVQSDEEPTGSTAAVIHPAVAAKKEEAEAAADVCCYVSGKTPCEWLEYGVIALDSFEEKFDISTAFENGYVVDKSSGAKVPNNKIRFLFYKKFTYEKFGHLGRGNRIKIPDCIEQQVKFMFPDLDGNYTNLSAEEQVLNKLITFLITLCSNFC